MIHLTLDIEKLFPFISVADLEKAEKEMSIHHRVLMGRTGPGNDFLGWMDLPSEIKEEQIVQIESEARRLGQLAEVVVVIGIGGSYLGAKAVVEALQHHFSVLMKAEGKPGLLFAGQNISEDYMADLLEALENKSFAVIVISKSGTTTEPAIAFRILKKLLEKKYGKEGAKQRIIAITDHQKGALKGIADREGYPAFTIPDNVGGRFSVLTPVGLLPIAAAGFNIRELIGGANEMRKTATATWLFDKNPAALYAGARNLLYRCGKPLEVLVNYEPSLHYLTEWWKQLYGESEGKQNRGIFPAGVNFTSDLHSMGQYLQDGLRILFETVISVDKPVKSVCIPAEADDFDGLNYLAGKPLHYINQMAELGTLLAHSDGGVPVMQLKISQINERNIGEVIYFFEFACALSAYMLGVNPFDQPGVEAYKSNMFALLGKAGFEERSDEIRKRLEPL